MNFSPAGKLDMIFELYNSGVLCNCTETKKVYNEDDDSWKEILVHDEKCTARDKALELLNLDI